METYMSLYELLTYGDFGSYMDANEAASVKVIYQTTSDMNSSEPNMESNLNLNFCDNQLKLDDSQKKPFDSSKQLKHLGSANEMNWRLLGHIHNLKINTTMLASLDSRDLKNLGVRDALTRRFLLEQFKLLHRGDSNCAELNFETMLAQLNKLQGDLQTELGHLRDTNCTHVQLSNRMCPRLVAMATLNRLHREVKSLKGLMRRMLTYKQVTGFFRTRRPCWMFAVGSAALVGMSMWRSWGQM